jgi:hypothetical protein
MGLATGQQGLQGRQISGLSALGASAQAQKQADLSAEQQLAQQQLMQPLTAAQAYGSGVTQLIAGYPGKDIQQTSPNAPTPSGLQTGLSTASTKIMSRVFRRPMFRGGSTNMNGIMSGIKDRENYAEGTPSERYKKIFDQYSKPAVDPLSKLLKQEVVEL